MGTSLTDCLILGLWPILKDGGMAWGQTFSQPAACQVVDLGMQGQRVQAGGMEAGTTSFSPSPQLSSDYPRMLQTEEDDLEFSILWPPASESPPPERIKEGFAG